MGVGLEAVTQSDWTGIYRLHYLLLIHWSRMTVSRSRWLLVAVVVVVLFSSLTEARRRKGGTCGLTCYRWRKCKGVLATLTSSEGEARPGQRGTTGQLIFKKCDDPPERCGCVLEPPKPTEPPKPKLPKVMLEFVDSEALDWLSNLVDIDP